MADSADVKPKLLSLSAIDDMVAKQEQLKQATPEMMYKSGHPGSMTRPSKLFIKVDREGLLTDTIAISDVVDFDCYESIVSSACRIISCFQSTKPENIEVEALFYYKKRARSTRMNPVMIRSTTDAFKAVAEHPVGEVPIGVRWNQRYKYKLVRTADNAKIAVPDTGTQSPQETGIKIAPKLSEDTEDAAPEKKRKLQEEIQKSATEPKKLMHNATSHISPFNQAYPVISSEAFKGSGSKTNPQQNITVKPFASWSKDDDKDMGDGEGKTEPGISIRYVPRHTHDPQYMFPIEARHELVVSYGEGVVEKKKLPEEAVRVVNMMLKGNYTFLTKEAQINLGIGPHSLRTEEKTEEPDSYPTGQKRSGVIEFETIKPIKYVKDAKSEIFRILSMLNVSKSRFKGLLRWMKTIKLEDGKKGKYLLSARDIIGGTKYVISSGFETDEQQVLKHDQTYKPYGSVVTNNGPPVSSASDAAPKQIPVPAIPEPPHNQIMFLMPTSLSSIPNKAPPVFKTSSGVTMVPTSKVLHVPVPPKSQSILPNAVSTSKNTQTAVGTAPPILRRRPRKSSQPSKSRDASPNPVPMNLYRSYHTLEDEGLSLVNKSVDKDRTLNVKVEPHEYDSETSDATLDYDRNSERDTISPRPGLHTDTFSPEHSVYSDSVSGEYDKQKVLKSDAAMPQSTETDRPFDIIIKSEPMDEYECP